ncbi:MAG: hypothetical protein GC161_02980 [Planctomycetaceae bacterium]|nr:hypothetical protein [Planctomycetaceae bacterium]
MCAWFGVLAGLQGIADGCEPDWWQAWGMPVSAIQSWAVGHTIETVDFGQGEQIWVGGDRFFFGPSWHRNLVRWRATHWDCPGGGTLGEVYSLLAGDLGEGPRLFIGGKFADVGGVPASRIAQYDGAQFLPLGSGVVGTGVWDLAIHDDGSGSALYVGGGFSSAGGQPISNIARWDGTTWSPLGVGLNGGVGSLCVFDAGAGPQLFASGSFTMSGTTPAHKVARWDGIQWHGVGYDAANAWKFAVHSFAAGERLVVGSATGLRVWDGAAWPALGAGVGAVAAPGYVISLASADSGDGPRLWASTVEQPQMRVWIEDQWHEVPTNDWSSSLVARGAPGEQRLFATGYFGSLDGAESPMAAVRHPCAKSTRVEVVTGCTPPPFRLAVHGSPPQVGAKIALGVAGYFPGGSGQTLVLMSPSLLPGVDAGGCGISIPSHGDLLLDTAIGLWPVAQGPLLFASSLSFWGDLATHELEVPGLPGLVGVSIALQAVAFQPVPPFHARLSNALELTLGG